MSNAIQTRFENQQEQAAYEQGMLHGETLGRFLGIAIRKDLENQELSEQKREQSYLATHDELTGLLNLRGLNDYLAEANVSNHVVIYVDGTNVKAINDKLGHEAGDKAIVGIADILTGALRKVDIVARIGGDEFLAILAPINRSGILMPVAKQLELVESRIADQKEEFMTKNPDLTAQGFEVAVGAAVGEEGSDIEGLKADAEKRMEEHKSVQHSQLGAYRG